jgi:hypothetical protein
LNFGVFCKQVKTQTQERRQYRQNSCSIEEKNAHVELEIIKAAALFFIFNSKLFNSFDTEKAQEVDERINSSRASKEAVHQREAAI